MSDSLRRLFAATALALTPLLATCKGSGGSTSPPASPFTIRIVKYGPPMPAAAQTAFDAAAAKWESIITRSLALVDLSVPAGTCGPNSPAVADTTTGLVILASVDSIDGPGKTLAQAGPCEVRQSDGLTAIGLMRFDSADVDTMIAQGVLNVVVLHEMGHVLGFGSLWGPPDSSLKANCLQLKSNPPGTIQDTYFSCARTRAVFDSIGGRAYTGGGSSPPAGNKVPVENCGTSPYVSPKCGAGTVNSHWREVVFGNELMVGFLPNSPRLSVVTVATMQDLGYAVNYAAADAYSHAFTAPPVGGVPRVWLGDDARPGPIYAVGANGAIVRVVRRR